MSRHLCYHPALIIICSCHHTIPSLIPYPAPHQITPPLVLSLILPSIDSLLSYVVLTVCLPPTILKLKSNQPSAIPPLCTMRSHHPPEITSPTPHHEILPPTTKSPTHHKISRPPLVTVGRLTCKVAVGMMSPRPCPLHPCQPASSKY